MIGIKYRPLCASIFNKSSHLILFWTFVRWERENCGKGRRHYNKYFCVLFAQCVCIEIQAYACNFSSMSWKNLWNLDFSKKISTKNWDKITSIMPSFFIFHIILHFCTVRTRQLRDRKTTWNKYFSVFTKQIVLPEAWEPKMD